MDDIETHRKWFLGGDCAPSDSQRSDDGALVGAFAEPKRAPEPGEYLSQDEADWWFNPVFCRVLNHKQRASARQWSAYIHDLHQRFGFEKICIDAAGGGIYVGRELAMTRQLIGGIERECIPIGDQVRAPLRVVHGHFILHYWKRSDPGVDAMFPPVPGASPMSGDDELKDAMYSETKKGLDMGCWRLLPHYGELAKEREEEWRRLSEEAKWSAINLTAGILQMQKITVLTDPDGLHLFTKRGAHRFASEGRDDIAMAMMYSYMAFLMWLRMGDFEPSDPESDVAFLGFGGTVVR